MPFIAVSSSHFEEMNLSYESHGAGEAVVLIHPTRRLASGRRALSQQI
jgi:hypothetical protein